MEFLTLYINQLGGAVAAATLLSPLIVSQLKKLFLQKKYHALLSPFVGFVLTLGFAIICKYPVQAALAMALAGISGGSIGSSIRDFIKFRKEKTV